VLRRPVFNTLGDTPPKESRALGAFGEFDAATIPR